ncbi:cytochrome c oxidase assembly factor 7 homolog [Orussus abietinus]|uniref:cytochrome c oxidase assembly factor 7 homolog n=1 Tax=Orussus abietinus TaxID=222816 RepID=UPI00062543E9|nr:cytochrome c oxidase assembly factor 7 homolog [Orussus abietinus]
MSYDFKNEDDVKEYLKNLYMEYTFGCYSEKNPEVCHLLGDYLEAIKADHKKAEEVYKANCDEFDFGFSCTKYGTYRYFGRNSEANIKDGYKYMMKGCENNNVEGCEQAGILSLGNSQIDDTDRSEQVKRGVAMLEKGCGTQKSDKSCFILAKVYLNGMKDYVEKNYSKAYKFFMISCDMGNPIACINVAEMLRRGDGVPKDDTLADAYKRRAKILNDEVRKIQKQLKFHEGIN